MTSHEAYQFLKQFVLGQLSVLCFPVIDNTRKREDGRRIVIIIHDQISTKNFLIMSSQIDFMTNSS